MDQFTSDQIGMHEIMPPSGVDLHVTVQDAHKDCTPPMQNGGLYAKATMLHEDRSHEFIAIPVCTTRKVFRRGGNRLNPDPGLPNTMIVLSLMPDCFLGADRLPNDPCLLNYRGQLQAIGQELGILVTDTASMLIRRVSEFGRRSQCAIALLAMCGTTLTLPQRMLLLKRGNK